MFDMNTSVVVEGSVAKLEWVNPHVFVWIYVEKPAQSGQYDLYAFENGPLAMLMRHGWTKDSLQAGEKISVHYFPLKDGRTGGYFIKAVHADGTVHIGDPAVPQVARELAKDSPLEQPTRP
jgi:hypothetical protein